MVPTSNFISPLPGQEALYYCFKCKKSFMAKVPEPGILNIFGQKKVKCPTCKSNCGLDPKIEY